VAVEMSTRIDVLFLHRLTID